MKIRVAARTSRLSLEQVRIAMEYASRKLGGLSYEVIGVKTLGDHVKDKPLHEIGRKGVFEKEVNKAVLDGLADVAIHSLKDLPSRLPNELEIVMVPPRGPRSDSLVPRRGLRVLPLEDLPPGTVVAAGSPRRKGAVLHTNSRVETTWIRGNVDTRLRRLDEGRADYLVAAEAGLARLGIERPRLVLDPERFVPTPGQGLIAVVALRETSIARLLREATHPETTREAEAEIAFLQTLRGGCGVPVGATAFAEKRVFIAADYSLTRPKPLLIHEAGGDLVEMAERAASTIAGSPGREW
ncbi:MAG: hydroxymethylbilane synthase [Desulfurococcales archaeon]|nr:hydroxymethylbilane synthase [Desulfurococcales archaeon]